MARTQSTMTTLGTPAPDFTLPDLATAKVVSLADFRGRILLLAFLSNHCPYVQHIRNGWAQLARDYQARGVAVIAISSNDSEAYPDDAPDKTRAEIAAAGYTFPYLFDESQAVARAFGAACTPDFFVFDADHRLVYRGQMDGARKFNDVPVDGADLRAALDALLEGRTVSGEQKPSLGCNIKWKPGNEPVQLTNEN